MGILKKCALDAQMEIKLFKKIISKSFKIQYALIISLVLEKTIKNNKMWILERNSDTLEQVQALSSTISIL